MTKHSGFDIVGASDITTSAFLRVEELRLTSPTGAEVRRTVVRHPGAVAVVALDGDDFVLIRQYRAPIDSMILEIPAGKLDVPGEDLEEAARRELEEEVGLRSRVMELLASVWTAPGFTDERISIYLASDVEAVAARPHGAEEEVAEVVRIPKADVPAMLANNEFEDAKTIVGLQAALARLA
ncbi:MAG: NUDIX hydrolase [Acidimicrobiia bacterium]|nr:NUDIX hydrolase [Acidimicrobiia bacterium]